MTSHRLPFSPKILRALAFGALIVIGQLFAGSAALAQPQSPDQAAARFYRWYMQSLAISQDPLRQSPVQMSAYVTPGLMGELTRRMRRKGLRADYFIQAQEFMDDWTTDIRVLKPRIAGNLATVVVVLGGTEESRRRLALTLTRDGTDWKISVVRLV